MWTQADIVRLKAAIATGVKQVMEGGRMVTYDTFESMVERLRMMEAEVNGSRRSLVEQVAFRRGDE